MDTSLRKFEIGHTLGNVSEVWIYIDDRQVFRDTMSLFSARALCHAFTQLLGNEYYTKNTSRSLSYVWVK